MRISIAGKICFVLLMIFSSVLLGVTTYQARLEHGMVLRLGWEEARHMLLATLAKQSIDRLAHQQASPSNATETQSSGTATITSQVIYPPLLTARSAHDKAEQKSWTGKRVENLVKQGKETQLILVSPFYLSATKASYQLEAPTPADEPAGIVRITYSLTQALDEVEQHLLITALLLCLFFGAGLLLALYIIRRQIVAPLTRLSLAMERAADLGDLSTRMVVERNDELGQLSENFNHLMTSLEERSSTQHKSDPR